MLRWLCRGIVIVVLVILFWPVIVAAECTGPTCPSGPLPAHCINRVSAVCDERCGDNCKLPWTDIRAEDVVGFTCTPGKKFICEQAGTFMELRELSDPPVAWYLLVIEHSNRVMESGPFVKSVCMRARARLLNEPYTAAEKAEAKRKEDAAEAERKKVWEAQPLCKKEYQCDCRTPGVKYEDRYKLGGTCISTSYGLSGIGTSTMDFAGIYRAECYTR